nr:reverse transcriptase domain-containing protein [Tanacetum cinerariifolium]
SRVDPTLLNDFKMATDGNDDPPVPDLRTMEELCQSSLNGRGASHGQNPPPAYQAPAYQALGYQALVHQAPIPQPQVVTTTGTLPSNTVTNPNEDLKGITTRSGNEYKGPTIPTTSSSLPKVVERETEVIKDMVHPTNNGSTKDVQPSVVQIETPIPNYEPVAELVNAPEILFKDRTCFD